MIILRYFGTLEKLLGRNETSTPFSYIGGTVLIGHYLLKAAQRKGWQTTSCSLNRPTEEKFVDNERYLHFDLIDRTLIKSPIDVDFDCIVPKSCN